MRRWVAGNHPDLNYAQLLEFMTLRPLLSAGQLAASTLAVESIQKRGSILVVRIKGLNSPIYYPAGVAVNQLWTVIAEQFYPSNYHFYEYGGARIRENDVVLDCGASEGLFSLLAGPRCRRVYAIEPLPDFADCLKLTLANVDNAEVLPYGLSNEVGKAVLAGKGMQSHVIHEGEGASIDLTTIDRLFFDTDIRVGFIKADIEGHEIQMLGGARKTISRDKPKISVTTYHDPSHARLIKDLLLEINPHYTIMTKGVTIKGIPVMLHAWNRDWA